MHELILVQDLSIVMAVSAATVILCRLLHLPVVLGYILAGFIIGPHTPPYSLIHEVSTIHIFSTLGIIFLMFSIGLEFSLTKLSKVGFVAVLAAVLEITLMIWIGFCVGKLFGWSSMDSIFLGAILSISSTTIIAKILMETKKIDEKFAQVILGILVVEDVLAVVIIAILSGIANTGTLTLHEVSWAMLKVIMFIAGLLGGGLLIVPRILAYAQRFHLSEMMVMVVLGLCLGVSFLAAKAGFSVALGAFLIGAIIAETKQSHQIVLKMESIRDMFTAIFFVSVGMLIDPALLQQYWLPVLVITLVTILGKVFACSLGVFLTGNNAATSLKVGLGLAQIGEFSFIIAQLGQNTQVTSSFLYPVAVCVCALTTISTPFLMNHSDRITRMLKGFAPEQVLDVAGLYTPWIAKITEGGINQRGKALILRDLAKQLPMLAFYVFGAVGVYMLALKFKPVLAMSDGPYWPIMVAAMLPFLIGCAYTMDKILWEVLFLNLVGPRNELYRSKNAGSIVHNILRFLVALLTGLVFTTIISFFAPTSHLGAAMLVVILICGVLLWRSVSKAHEHFESIFLSIFDRGASEDEGQAKVNREQFVELLRGNKALEFETQDVMVPYHPCALNVSIAELNLRAQTGASIVAIYRDEESLANPGPQTNILPGDVLLLIGSEEQLKSSVQYLRGKMTT